MPSIDKYGTLVVVCGFSGSGKSTLARGALDAFPDRLGYMNTFTTRPRRPDESTTEYAFVTEAEYKEHKASASLWDESEIYGNRYGLDAGKYTLKLCEGKNFIVCSIPSNDIIQGMAHYYGREHMATIKLCTPLEISAERQCARDARQNLGRLVVDQALEDGVFNADYTFKATDNRDNDRIRFNSLIEEIIS